MNEIPLVLLAFRKGFHEGCSRFNSSRCVLLSMLCVLHGQGDRHFFIRSFIGLFFLFDFVPTEIERFPTVIITCGYNSGCEVLK